MIQATNNPTGALKGVTVIITDDSLSNVDQLSFVVCPSPGMRNHTIGIKVASETPDTELTAGTVQIETNVNPDDSEGGWAPLGGGPVDLTEIAVVGETGLLELQFSELIIKALRLRIIDEVTGGVIESVFYTGQ
jgi:hypothetical protein